MGMHQFAYSKLIPHALYKQIYIHFLSQINHTLFMPAVFYSTHLGCVFLTPSVLSLKFIYLSSPLWPNPTALTSKFPFRNTINTVLKTTFIMQSTAFWFLIGPIFKLASFLHNSYRQHLPKNNLGQVLQTGKQVHLRA